MIGEDVDSVEAERQVKKREIEDPVENRLKQR